jgi:hypothetical protein
MFLEPELFTAAPNLKKDAQSPGTGAHDIKLRSESIRARFWMARAKRENGGLERRQSRC